MNTVEVQDRSQLEESPKFNKIRLLLDLEWLRYRPLPSSSTIQLPSARGKSRIHVRKVSFRVRSVLVLFVSGFRDLLLPLIFSLDLSSPYLLLGHSLPLSRSNLIRNLLMYSLLASTLTLKSVGVREE